MGFKVNRVEKNKAISDINNTIGEIEKCDRSVDFSPLVNALGGDMAVIDKLADSSYSHHETPYIACLLMIKILELS